MIKNKYAPIIESMRELSRVFGAVIEESEPTETRLYACGALPVSLTLPEGEQYSSSYTQDREFKRIGVRPPNMYWE